MEGGGWEQLREVQDIVTVDSLVFWYLILQEWGSQWFTHLWTINKYQKLETQTETNTYSADVWDILQMWT